MVDVLEFDLFYSRGINVTDEDYFSLHPNFNVTRGHTSSYSVRRVL